MLTGSNQQQAIESPIFEDLSLYKVVTKNKIPIMLHKNGGCSLIIPFSGINSTSFTEKDFEGIFRTIRRTIDSVGRDVITIQFLACRSSDVSVEVDESLPSYLKPRAVYFNELAQNNQIFKNEYYLSIFVAQPLIMPREAIRDFIKKLLLKRNPLVDQYQKAQDGIEERVRLCFETQSQLLSMFRDLGFSGLPLQTKEEYYNVLQKFTRPNKSKGELIKIDSLDHPRQALFSGVRAEAIKKSFTLDEYFHKVYTLDRVPKDLIYGKTLEVIHSVPFEYMYSVCFKALSLEDANSQIRRRLLEQRVLSGPSQDALVADRVQEAEEKRIDDAYTLFSYGGGGENTGVTASVNMVVKIKESLLERKQRETRLSRAEILRDIDYKLSKDLFPKFGGSEWVSEDNTSWPVFCQLIPGMCNLNSNRLKTLFLTSENVPYFLALWDTKRPIQHDGTNHFVDERGNFITFDLMDRSLPAWNYFFSGQTGSGKSVLVNTILTMQFAETANLERPIACILDVGGDYGSYLKFMKLVKGSIINLSGAKKPHIQMLEINPGNSTPTPKKIEDLSNLFLPLSKLKDVSVLKVSIKNFYAVLLDKGRNNMNEKKFSDLFEECLSFPLPQEFRALFNLKPGECEPAGNSLNMISGILEMMLSTSPTVIDGYQQFDADLVMEYILGAYREHSDRFPTLTDLYDLCKNGSEKQDIAGINEKADGGKRFLSKIHNWTRDGANSMFDMATDIDLSNDVTLVDLKGLDSMPHLQRIYTLLFSELFSNKMYFTKGRRKFIVRDEAWSLMNNDRARKYLVEDLRTARKNNFATLTISQSPTDVLYPNQHDGQVILEQMQVHFIGKMNSEATALSVGRALGIPDDIAIEMNSLGQVKRIQPDGSSKTEYSRFMMKVGEKEIYILRNVLHPFERALYSSSADDNAIIDYYMNITQAYSELEDVLWLMARGQHVGDEGLYKYLESAGFKDAARSVRFKK